MIKVSFTRFSSIKSCSLSFPVMDPDFSDSFLNLSKTLLTSLFRLSVPKPIRKPKIWSGTPKIWPRKPKSWSGLSPTFRMTSLEPRSSTRNLLCSKTRNCCYKGHKGRRGLTEGLDVLHGSFRGPLEANGPYEAGQCDLRGHRGRILTFGMTSEASRGRGVCVRAEFLKKRLFKKTERI